MLIAIVKNTSQFDTGELYLFTFKIVALQNIMSNDVLQEPFYKLLSRCV